MEGKTGVKGCNDFWEFQFIQIPRTLRVTIPKKSLGHNACMTLASKPLKGANLNNPRYKPGDASKIESDPRRGSTRKLLKF